MAAQLSVPVSDRDHILGPSTASVTLVEYGDFECPHCKAAAPAVRRAREIFGDSLRFVFRHFPITVSHRRAEMAAEAAEAAAAQGRFWEMHDRLFAHQDDLSRDALIGHARELGLDIARFEADLDTHRYAPRVDEDLESGEESGASWTPTFYINGVRSGPAADLDALVTALERAGARRLAAY